MDILNKTEYQAAKTIIDAGLKRAAETLSFFMKEPIGVEQIDLNEVDIETKDSLSLQYGPNTHLLITEVVGELEGVCCLVFSEHEAKLLQQAALPPEITNSPAMFDAMKDAILLEADNIITASVITQFANLLNRKMHGSVPQLRVINNPEFEQLMQEHLSNQSHIINFKTTFVSSQKSFSPMFIWFMNSPFIEDIKSYAANQQIEA